MCSVCEIKKCETILTLPMGERYSVYQTWACQVCGERVVENIVLRLVYSKREDKGYEDQEG